MDYQIKVGSDTTFKNDRHDITNYRTIAQLPIPCKFLEKTVYDKIHPNLLQ